MTGTKQERIAKRIADYRAAVRELGLKQKIATFFKVGTKDVQYKDNAIYITFYNETLKIDTKRFRILSNPNGLQALQYRSTLTGDWVTLP